MRLSDARVKALTPPAGRGSIEIQDEDCRGLYLRVLASGSRAWILRWQVEKKSRRVGLGRHPDVSLAEARRKALKFREDVAAGRDRLAQARDARATRATASTLEEVFALFLKSSRAKERTILEWRRIFLRDIGPEFGEVSSREIRRRAAIEHFETAGAGREVAANRGFQLLSQILAFAADREIIPVSPLAGAAKPFRETSRARTLSDEELGALMAKLHAPPIGVSWTMAAALKLCLLTAQRAGNVAAMRRVDLDRDARLWTIPPEAFKTGRSLLVPLSEGAIEALDALGAFEADGFVFAKRGAMEEAMTRRALTRAMARVAEA